jgi:hypothetical protein
MVAVLGVVTALMTLAAAALGLLTASATEKKEEAQDRASSLSQEVAALNTEKGKLADEVTTLEEQKASLQQEVDQLRSAAPTPAGPDPTEIPTGLVYLSKEDMIDREAADRGSQPVNGTVYSNSVLGYQSYCGSASRETHADFDLGRRYTTLTGTLGLSDKNRSAALKVRFEILLDNRSMYNETIGAGAAESIKISVKDKLRIRLKATFLTQDDCLSTDKAVWGDIAVS